LRCRDLHHEGAEVAKDSTLGKGPKRGVIENSPVGRGNITGLLVRKEGVDIAGYGTWEKGKIE